VVIVSLPLERVEIRPELRCAALLRQDAEERECGYDGGGKSRFSVSPFAHISSKLADGVT
jgi:hypothetical protein